MQKTKIKLSILLPEVPDERDERVHRIIEVMQQHKGMDEAHVAGDGKEAQLCFHYNPDIICIDQIQERATMAGAVITQHFGHLLLDVDAFRELDDAAGIGRGLRDRNGPISVSVSAAGAIGIGYDQQKVAKDRILEVLTK